MYQCMTIGTEMGDISKVIHSTLVQGYNMMAFKNRRIPHTTDLTGKSLVANDLRESGSLGLWHLLSTLTIREETRKSRFGSGKRKGYSSSGAQLS